jgi:Rrf2 family protein
VSLAFHALAILACAPPGERYSISRLRVGEASVDHLSKVLQRLVRAGLLSSRRGARGGFSLRRPAYEISLLDIWTALEGPIEDAPCPLHGNGCPITRCVFGDWISQGNRTLADYFSETTLEMLASPEGEPEDG